MSVSATLTMLVSTTSSNAPSATAIAIDHLPVAPAALRVARSASPGWASVTTTDCAIEPRIYRLFASVDGEVDAHSGAQRDARGQLVQSNTHGYSLHDFGEVA